jgi:chemotaxis protein MotB
MRTKIIISTLMLLGVFYSCVPLKQLDENKKYAESLQDSNELLKEQNRELTVENRELDAQVMNLQKRFQELEKRAEMLKEKANDLEYNNQQLSRNEAELEKQIELLKAGSSDEISSLLSELQKMQEDLQEREDRVKQAEKLLAQQQQRLHDAEEALKQKEKELAMQQARLMELQDALDRQKSAVNDLKEKLNNALRGFYDQGLSVYEKNGKVYVSLEENLMFKTGSYLVDPEGQKALESLGEVLANNPGINIMVEGHTDNVPLNGAGQVKDNWDLSVMRATAVTKIILRNPSIHPQRITAAGRSEFVPLDEANTPDARRKNRRTEIILTPDLSEVLEIIQSN